ncbi:MAG: hypothetical protein AAFV85_23090 [Cyanobacteria bacterium J06634_6]
MAEAISVYESELLKKLEYQARPLANLGTVTARLHGVKQPDTAWFNEYELIQRKRDINELFPKEVAQFYVAQWEAKKVPSWVDDITDIDKMKLAAL